jgi:phospholipase/lecithinase/hemolysin
MIDFLACTQIIPLTPYIENVTNEIVANVHRLQKLGAQKILVNNMHPLGCMPRHTRVNNHTRCESHGNFIATTHNSMLQQKLGNNSNVLILDLYTAFTNVINNQTPGKHMQDVIRVSICQSNLNSDL